MKIQIKTLFASFLLLIALCFGAFAAVGEKHALGDFGTAQQHVGQNPEAIQLVSLGNFASSAKSTAECCNATNNVRAPVTNPTSAQLAAANDLGVDARWVRADGSIDWPPNNGFDGPPTITEIQPGTRFDRYGGSFDQNGQFVDTGGFVSPSGVPFDQRSLPASSTNRPFQEYEVLQPIPNVNSGTAAPWFGQQGGGTQYQLPMNINQLVEQGFIRPVFD